MYPGPRLSHDISQEHAINLTDAQIVRNDSAPTTNSINMNCRLSMHKASESWDSSDVGALPCQQTTRQQTESQQKMKQQESNGEKSDEKELLRRAQKQETFKKEPERCRIRRGVSKVSEEQIRGNK